MLCVIVGGISVLATKLKVPFTLLVVGSCEIIVIVPTPPNIPEAVPSKIY